MAKYLVETYYTCTFKVNHYLDDINETELKNLEKRDDGKFEVLDVKLDNRKTKSLDPNNKKNDQNKKIDLSSEPFRTLFEKNSLEAKAEVQWRISPAIALIILVFMAIPLSKSSPRDSRYTGLILGILIYMIYVNCLGAARVWLEQGVTPEIYGLWWIHLIALMVGIVMLSINYRVFERVFSGEKED